LGFFFAVEQFSFRTVAVFSLEKSFNPEN